MNHPSTEPSSRTGKLPDNVSIAMAEARTRILAENPAITEPTRVAQMKLRTVFDKID